MSMKGIFWGVLAPGHPAYLDWLEDGEKPKGFDLQRCKYISRMLDVYQAQKGGVEIIQLDGWIDQWTGEQIEEIQRRLQL